MKYKEPLLLFHKENGKLHNVSAEAGPAFTKSFAARGLAVGDYDNDGRVDVLIGNNGGRSGAAAQQCRRRESLAGREAGRREVQSRRHRRADHLVGGRSDAVALKNGGGSYLSSHDPREVLGLARRRR